MQEKSGFTDPTLWSDKNPEFTLKGLKVPGQVVSVYDGDSCKIVMDVPFIKGYFKWTCRINGIDTPELRCKDEKEKTYGKFVRDRLREMILDKTLTVTCGDFDKYGRLLVNLTITRLYSLEQPPDVIDISKYLISKGYAFEYNGGTKKSWSEYLKDKDLDSLMK